MPGNRTYYVPTPTRYIGQQKRSPKIRTFCYHYGVCHRDPANPVKSGKLCVHQHYMELGVQAVQLSKTSLWQHKVPCGLGLCPYRDLARKTTADRNAAKEAKKTAAGEPQDVLKAAEKLLTPDEDRVKPSRKRKAAPDPSPPLAPKIAEQKVAKRPLPHLDTPTHQLKRARISYDERSGTSTPTTTTKSETCFFWYHGRCPRSLDSRRIYTFPFQHSLTNPPMMVQPPRGYKHARACGLEWCPGDSLEGTSRTKGGGLKGLERVGGGGGGWRPGKSEQGEEGGERRAGSEVPSCGQVDDEDEERGEWFLTGFD